MNNQQSLAPIALFTFNRLDHTKLTLEALQKNHLAAQSELFVFCDGPRIDESLEGLKKINDLRAYLRKTLGEGRGFKSVTFIEQRENLGLANSIIKGITEVIDRFGKIIVLEDDILTSTLFLTFLNQALDRYKKEPSIFSLAGYHHPITTKPSTSRYDAWMFYRASSWGWATWDDRWKKARWDMPYSEDFLKNRLLQKKFEKGGEDLSLMLEAQMAGKINSWAIRWSYTLCENDGLCVYPIESYVQNIGHDGSGVHCAPNSKYKTTLSVSDEDRVFHFPPVGFQEPEMQNELRKFYSIGIRGRLKRFLQLKFR